jgi:hypothetical protein
MGRVFVEGDGGWLAVLAAAASIALGCSGSSSGANGTKDGGIEMTGDSSSGADSSGTVVLESGSGATGDSGPSATDATAAGSDAGACATDPLRTGLVAQQTGVSVDAFDCPILKWAAYYKEPDPMIFKAIIYVESRFDQTAVACPNYPCGTPAGWTAAESGCYGLM